MFGGIAIGEDVNYDKVMCDFLCEKYEDRHGKSSLNEIKNYHAMYGNPNDFYSSVLSAVSKGLDSHFYYVLSEGKNICYDGIQTDEAINHILSLKNELSLSIKNASNIDAGFNDIPIPYNKVVEKNYNLDFLK